MAEPSCDRTVDVVVVGTGASGLSAAIAAADAGCRVEMFEKSDEVGGTSAVSGGGIWVPGNSHMAELQVEDSREEALAYVRAVTAGREVDPHLLEVYVDRAKEAMDWVEENTPLGFRASEFFSDYYQDKPGAKDRARTLEPLPFPSRERLGEWDEKIRGSRHFPRLTLDEISSDDEAKGGASGSVALSEELLALKAKREREGIRTNGESIVASLLRGALDRSVEVHTGARVDRLTLDADHRVVGVEVETDEGREAIEATCGVVIATGGFEWNEELVRAFLGVPALHPASAPISDGEGLIMGLEAGAAVDNMSVAWAYPTTYDGKATYDGKPFYQQGTPRQEPGCIVVNRAGRRFSNEGVCYMDFGKAHRTYDPVAQTYPNESPVWAIFDQTVRDRIALGDLAPGSPTPEWVMEAETIEELAGKAGIDPAGLADEVAKFNRYVADRHDPDFSRGTVWFEGFSSGGPSPEKSLAPVARAPFYAMAIFDGALGTAGGLKIDENARVRAMRGGFIDGLYAVGNAAASIFGPMYPSGGVTLGPGIMFGYLAGQHLAARLPSTESAVGR